MHDSEVVSPQDLAVWALIIGGKTLYECWNFNSGNYLFTTDTK